MKTAPSLITILLFLSTPNAFAETYVDQLIKSSDGDEYICSLHQVNNSTVTIKPFETDGCSSSPDGTGPNGVSWRHCCVEHDKDYWVGGTSEQRLASDERLKKCIGDTGYTGYARVAYSFVRAAGGPYQDVSYRWGFGWPYGRGYLPKNKEQLINGFIWSQAEVFSKPELFDSCELQETL